MSFGQLVPGMAPMPIPQMQPNQMMKMGMAAMQQARQQQRGVTQAPAGPGQPLDLAAPQPNILQRLLNPSPDPLMPSPNGPNTYAPMVGGPPNADPSQMGMLAKLFPALAGGGMGAAQPMAPPNALGGLY